MIFRDFSTGDKPTIEAWWDIDDIERYVERPTERWSRYVVEGENVICRCMEVEGEIRAYLQCDMEPEGAYVSVVTHPHHRREGCAMALIRDLVPELKER